MQIRTATITDLASVARCADLAFASFVGHWTKRDVEMKGNLRSQIVDGSIQLICDGARVLGYISFWPAAGQMFIDTLAVLRSTMGRGSGVNCWHSQIAKLCGSV